MPTREEEGLVEVAGPVLEEVERRRDRVLVAQVVTGPV